LICIVDMDMGNLQSVVLAFRRVGASAEVTDRPDKVAGASGPLAGARAIVLPGVGAFGAGMESLRRKGWVEVLQEAVRRRKTPLLGICLGMQLLAEEGIEGGRHQGLGMIRGRVVPLRPPSPEYRVPHMGWCDVKVHRPHSSLLKGFSDGEPCYFAHSYSVECADPADIAATFDYGAPLPAAVERENVFGIQFHPEKSQEAGLALLDTFSRYVRERA
jgi:glutamine amidotransferase